MSMLLEIILPGAIAILGSVESMVYALEPWFMSTWNGEVTWPGHLD